MELISPLQRLMRLVSPDRSGALSLEAIWSLAGPTTPAITPDDKRYLMRLCRNRTIVRACATGRSLKFVR